MRVVVVLGAGFFVLALPAATVGAAVLECSGRFPETDVCPGRPDGVALVVAAGTAALIPFVGGLVLAVRTRSDRRAAMVMTAAGIVMFALATGIEAWATGTVF